MKPFCSDKDKNSESLIQLLVEKLREHHVLCFIRSRDLALAGLVDLRSTHVLTVFAEFWVGLGYLC